MDHKGVYELALTTDCYSLDFISLSLPLAYTALTSFITWIYENAKCTSPQNLCTIFLDNHTIS